MKLEFWGSKLPFFDHLCLIIALNFLFLSDDSTCFKAIEVILPFCWNIIIPFDLDCHLCSIIMYSWVRFAYSSSCGWFWPMKLDGIILLLICRNDWKYIQYIWMYLICLLATFAENSTLHLLSMQIIGRNKLTCNCVLQLCTVHNYWFVLLMHTRYGMHVVRLHLLYATCESRWMTYEMQDVSVPWCLM